MEIRGANGLRRAMRDYRRLCADQASADYNRTSGAIMIYEGLSSSPRAYDIMLVISGAPWAVSTIYICRALGRDETQSNIGTQLLSLTEYGLLARDWVAVPGQAGGHWVYKLSELGQVVMSYEGAGHVD